MHAGGWEATSDLVRRVLDASQPARRIRRGPARSQEARAPPADLRHRHRACSSTRGFDEVKVSDVAAACDVSEKTVYNYFPTKESLLFDQEETTAAQIREALRERG